MRGGVFLAAMPLGIALILGGCGTYVPEIQEFPGDSIEGQRFVQAIVTNVTCEVRNAVAYLYTDYKTTFLDDWGVQITLILTIDEKGAVNPTVNWFPPSPATAIFNLAGRANASADATRIDTLNSYYLVDELRYHACPPENRTNGLFLMQSDLKLKEWLYDAVTASVTNTVHFAGSPIKENVLSHEVKFEITTGGDITPSWKLTRVLVNPNGPFLSASRNRIQRLIVTFGRPRETSEIVHGKKQTVISREPSTQAAYLHLSSTIGAAVSDGVKNALGQ